MLPVLFKTRASRCKATSKLGPYVRNREVGPELGRGLGGQCVFRRATIKLGFCALLTGFFSLLMAAQPAMKRTDEVAPGAEMAEAPANSSHPSLLSPENRLDDPNRDPAWRELFGKLAPNRTRQSNFEERRYFPFRRAPVVLRGEIRLEPERGLSLHYLEPEPHVMIVDAKGILVRDADGRERTPPADGRAQAATKAMVSVLRFDFAALQKDFAVYGRQDASSWTLLFVPRDPAFANLLGNVLVTGVEGTVTSIEMIKSSTQRIEIMIRDTRERVLFTGDTLRRFFR